MEKFKDGIFFINGDISKIERKPYKLELLIYLCIFLSAIIMCLLLFKDSIIAWSIVGFILFVFINVLVSKTEIIINHKIDSLKLLRKTITGSKKDVYTLSKLNFQLKKIVRINYNSGRRNEKIYFIIISDEAIIETSIEIDNDKSYRKFRQILENLTRKSVSLDLNDNEL